MCRARGRVSVERGREGEGRDPHRSLGRVLGMIGRLYLLEDRHLNVIELAMKARKPGLELRSYTNEENKTFGGSFNIGRPFHLKFAHARHNGADEVDIKYREDVDQMERQRDGQKAKAIDSSHPAVS